MAAKENLFSPWRTRTAARGLDGALVGINKARDLFRILLAAALESLHAAATAQDGYWRLIRRLMATFPVVVCCDTPRDRNNGVHFGEKAESMR